VSPVAFHRICIRISSVASLLLALFFGSLNARAADAPASPGPILVGYFGQWGVYDHFFVKNLVTSEASAQLDQIDYSQGAVKGGRCSIADPNADLNLTFTAADSVTGIADNPASAFRGNLHQLAALKKRFPHLKILISLEGSAADFALGAQPENRSAFVASCVDTFIRGHFAHGAEDAHLFDGIDVDWEYPKAEDAANYVELLTQLREAMNMVRPGLRLSIAVGASPHTYGGVNMVAVSHIVDQIGIMNYDYAGPWNPKTGFLAPLYSDHGGSVETSIREYRAAGVPAEQLLMGMPFYGYGWQKVGGDGHGLFQEGRGIHGDRPYSFLETLATAATVDDPNASDAAGNPPAAPPATTTHAAEKRPTATATPFTIYRDPRSQAPWLYDGDTFWTFDDPTSIRFKVRFALGQRLGGVMAWELSEDTANAALLRAARSAIDQRSRRNEQASDSGIGSAGGAVTP
jgi:chitinase